MDHLRPDARPRVVISHDAEDNFKDGGLSDVLCRLPTLKDDPTRKTVSSAQTLLGRTTGIAVHVPRFNVSGVRPLGQ